MFYLRQADKRGRTQTDWLDSRHTFLSGSIMIRVLWRSAT